MSDSVTISILILANHLDERFEQCLSSAAWASEVVIGWTGENDPTPDEKKTLTRIIPAIKIIRLPGAVTDFSATRNLLHAKATSDWVFWLDSDEVIRPESISTIERVITSNELGGAMVKRLDVFDGKVLRWGEVRNVKLLRMFHRLAGSFIRPVHEVAVVEGEVVDPGIVIEHFAHSSISSFISKVITYAQMEAKLRHKQGRKTTVLELILWPTGKFFKSVFLDLAFMDGWRGIAYAMVMSIHSLAVRACLIELWQPKTKVSS